MASARSTEDTGDNSDGFITAVHPAAIAPISGSIAKPSCIIENKMKYVSLTNHV